MQIKTKDLGNELSTRFIFTCLHPEWLPLIVRIDCCVRKQSVKKTLHKALQWKYSVAIVRKDLIWLVQLEDIQSWRKWNRIVAAKNTFTIKRRLLFGDKKKL